jgi:alpha-beta hydrolase superfamily lysophospholipase
MKHLEFAFSAADTLQLFGQSWEPIDNSQPPRALVCLVHGFGEHSGRYAHVAQMMTDAGFIVIAMDQRGHGRSQGKRGYTPEYDQSLQDIGTFIAESQRRFPNLPTFLYGHSMGGNMVLGYTLFKKPQTLHGVISTSPWLRLTTPPPSIQITGSKLISKLIPTFTITNEFEPLVLTHDPAVDEAYNSDPHNHGQISAKLFLGVTENGEEIIRRASEFPLPLLLVHGTADPVTSHTASTEFAAAAPRATTTFKEWDGLYHETHNEPEQEEVISYTVQWLQNQLNTADASA